MLLSPLLQHIAAVKVKAYYLSAAIIASCCFTICVVPQRQGHHTLLPVNFQHSKSWLWHVAAVATRSQANQVLPEAALTWQHLVLRCGECHSTGHGLCCSRVQNNTRSLTL